jgi:hypothetical protein
MSDASPKERNRRPLAVVCVVVLLGALVWLSTPVGERFTGVPVVQLPSGRKVRVLEMGTVHFTQEKPALMIKYETGTSFDDVPALMQEAKELAVYYRSSFKRSGRETVIFRANEPMPNTLFSKTRGYGFVADKQPDGTWKFRE